MAEMLHEQGLQKWVESILDPLSIAPSIFANQGKPRAIPPFASILILSDAPVYQPQRSTSYDAGEDEVTRSIKLTEEGTVAVTIYGGDHNLAALKLIASAYEQNTLELLNTYDLAVFGGSNQNIGKESDGVTENRSLVEFGFRYAFVDKHVDSNYIDTVIIEDTVDG